MGWWKSDKQIDAEIKADREKDARRGAKESAALRLKYAEKAYAENPNKINEAALDAARDNIR